MINYKFQNVCFNLMILIISTKNQLYRFLEIRYDIFSFV